MGLWSNGSGQKPSKFLGVGSNPTKLKNNYNSEIIRAIDRTSYTPLVSTSGRQDFVEPGKIRQSNSLD